MSANGSGNLSPKEKKQATLLMAYYRSMKDRIIDLHFSHEMPADEISKKLNIPISYVNQQIWAFTRRGRQSLDRIRYAL